MIQKLCGSHPNLLRLFGWVFPEPDVLHVVMEKADKGLLRALQEGLPLVIRMNIALDVAEGLKAIHDINYTYEDLKPGNILVRIKIESASGHESGCNLDSGLRYKSGSTTIHAETWFFVVDCCRCCLL